VNVLANPQFGTVQFQRAVLAYTWSENAHEFRLTPWGRSGGAIPAARAFLTSVNEERGHFWSPCAAACRGAAPYATGTDSGYSVFEHTERGIRSELWVYVALDAPIKFTVAQKCETNRAGPAGFSATGYAEWVLGDTADPKSSMHVITEIDPNSGALFARIPL